MTCEQCEHWTELNGLAVGKCSKNNQYTACDQECSEGEEDGKE